MLLRKAKQRMAANVPVVSGYAGAGTMGLKRASVSCWLKRSFPSNAGDFIMPPALESFVSLES